MKRTSKGRATAPAAPLGNPVRPQLGDSNSIAARAQRTCRQPTLRLVRKTSVDALTYFKANNIRFDLIHVDGNHDARHVLEDVTIYLPLLRKNGFLVMDDVSWKSTHPAQKYVGSRLRFLMECVAPDLVDDYAVFWNCTSTLKTWFLRRRIHRVAEWEMGAPRQVAA